jgi:hypothetical protein
MSSRQLNQMPWTKRKNLFRREIFSVPNGPRFNLADYRAEQFKSSCHQVFPDRFLTHANPLHATEGNRFVAVSIVKIPLVVGSVNDRRPDAVDSEKRQRSDRGSLRPLVLFDVFLVDQAYAHKLLSHAPLSFADCSSRHAKKQSPLQEGA